METMESATLHPELVAMNLLETQAEGRARLLDKIPGEAVHSEVTSRLAQFIALSPPGSRLPTERALSEKLGVGRSSIREALRSLSFIGAVHARQGSGTYVSTEESYVGKLIGLGLMMQRSTMSEVIEARRTLELQAVRLAACRHDEHDRKQLEAVMRKMEFSADDLAMVARYDLELHVTLARAGHNSVLAHFITGMRVLFEIWIQKAAAEDLVIESILAEHQEILDAVFARDPDRAERCMGEHLKRSANHLMKRIDPALPTTEYASMLLVPGD